MTGMNSTECGFLFHHLSEHRTPGVAAGWSEEQFNQNYIAQTKALGGDEAKGMQLIATLKKIYAAGRDMSGQHEYSRIHALYGGDFVRFKLKLLVVQ